MYNVSASKETQITISGSAENPAIYGDKIVWVDSYKFYMYDFSTQKETQVTNGQSAFPVLHDNKIIWLNYRNGNNWNIYLYDLAAQKETKVTNEAISRVCPNIYRNRIVWEFPYDSYINADICMGTIISAEENNF